MPVRTTRVDVLALARSAPPAAPRGRTGGGGGSFGLGLAPSPEPEPDPFDYAVTPDESLSFDATTVEGASLTTFTPADSRLTISAISIVADTGSVFATDDVTLLRGPGTVEDGETYEVTLEFTFDGDNLAPPTQTTETFTFEVFSIG